ncbi:hypothetical protein SUGI_0387720 [Cryptomeria japonica]|nr:hypothetical protein SUGI_0387720 [Cryptomeria japonica]
MQSFLREGHWGDQVMSLLLYTRISAPAAPLFGLLEKSESNVFRMAFAASWEEAIMAGFVPNWKEHEETGGDSNRDPADYPKQAALEAPAVAFPLPLPFLD